MAHGSSWRSNNAILQVNSPKLQVRLLYRDTQDRDIERVGSACIQHASLRPMLQNVYQRLAGNAHHAAKGLIQLENQKDGARN